MRLGVGHGVVVKHIAAAAVEVGGEWSGIGDAEHALGATGVVEVAVFDTNIGAVGEVYRSGEEIDAADGDVTARRACEGMILHLGADVASGRSTGRHPKVGRVGGHVIIPLFGAIQKLIDDNWKV